jgi:hypothetical protein
LADPLDNLLFGGCSPTHMLKENETIGVIGIYRQEVRPFNDKQIELVICSGN